MTRFERFEARWRLHSWLYPALIAGGVAFGIFGGML